LVARLCKEVLDGLAIVRCHVNDRDLVREFPLQAAQQQHRTTTQKVPWSPEVHQPQAAFPAVLQPLATYNLYSLD
jgi:hypothetical protein